MAGHALGLLLCGGVGTLVVCGSPASGQGWIASLGAAAVTAAAIGADLLMRCDDRPAQARASLLLMCACVVPAVPALLHGGWPATQSAARETALVRAVEPGARLYVWGGLAAMECYASAEAAPATPQIGTWMVEGGGLPVDGAHRLPDVATLSGLDRCLSKALPRYIIVTQGVTASLADLPRFGPLFRTRYREAAKTGAGTLFERQ